MSHTRGKDQDHPGKFSFVCYDWNGAVFRAAGGFDTAQAADRAAERAEREMIVAATMAKQGENPADKSLLDVCDQASEREQEALEALFEAATQPLAVGGSIAAANIV